MVGDTKEILFEEYVSMPGYQDWNKYNVKFYKNLYEYIATPKIDKLNTENDIDMERYITWLLIHSEKQPVKIEIIK